MSGRLGYSTSAGVYLPDSAAGGMTIDVTSGTANVFAGLPSAGSHRLLTTLAAGQSYLFASLAAGEVISVQAEQTFGYVLTIPPTNPTATPRPTQTATETVKMGEERILSADHSGVGSVLVTQQTALAQNGTLQSLSFYVTRPVGQLVLGVYDDAGGQERCGRKPPPSHR